MPGTSIFAWLKEQEKRRRPFIFVSEWAFIFAVAGAIWTGTLSVWQHAPPSNALVIAASAFYATAIVYPRLFNLTRCRKCYSLLPLRRHEIDRQHVRDREECTEFEWGGETWGGHFIQLYRRTYDVEKVRLRCRRCHAVWQELEEFATSGYELVRTIDLDSDK